MTNSKVISLIFTDDGLIPNNPNLPVILYRGALLDKPEEAESLFNQNGWLNSWTNGVFSYHHYHSNSHEVLGVISGSAQLQLGGEQGQAFQLQAGDVVLLPAGTGHKKLAASPDFRIVGAYPDGMDYNTRRATPEEREAALKEISRVPVPDTDPVYGREGPLHELWKNK
ncbi:cupin domain-containing protein [Paenibacillus tuaregi]|uniref:cupin domain-containing protein n=1 Tax=Paenibacillus tuaregi TaxID=1816681 RepID=UPI00083896DD|nr:cupin domain-containing protein [Paenibacillus tuaregi]